MPSLSPQSSPATADRTGRKLRVLYAEDMPELRDLVKIVLGREGHLIETVPNGAVGRDRIASPGEGFDLVITDHHMPELNGLDFVRSLRDRAFPGKILVFSSEVSPVILDQYRELGVDWILPKPVFPATLRETLQQLFPA